ncbi:MAG: hypothetical protein WAL95_13690 [Candidatus Acidiferrales bacterium]
MSRLNAHGIAHRVTLSLPGLTLLSPILATQSVKVEGLIKARVGDTIILSTFNSPDLFVLLTHRTEVRRVHGVFKARRKQMPVAALIPGLAVKVEGTYNQQDQLVAKSVSFKGNDLEHAEKFEGGTHETKVQVQQNKENLEERNAAAKTQNEALQKRQSQLTEHQAKIPANDAAVDAAIARFSPPGDYYVFEELTAYFGRGKVKVDPKYDPQLLTLAAMVLALSR